MGQSICPGSEVLINVEPQPDVWSYSWTNLEAGPYELHLAQGTESQDRTQLGDIDVVELDRLQIDVSSDHDAVLEGQPIEIMAQLQAVWSDGSVEDAPGGWTDYEDLRVEFRPIGGSLKAVTGWRNAPYRSGSTSFYVPATETGEYRVASRNGEVRTSAFTVVRVTPQAFTDIPWDHPAATPITWMNEQGISKGYSDGTFRPNLPTLRGHMAIFLYRLAGEPAFTPPQNSPFSDVPTSHPAYEAITWLAAEGVSKGYSDGTFRPNAPTQRGHMAVFLYRMAGEPSFDAPAVTSFYDVPHQPLRLHADHLAGQ